MFVELAKRNCTAIGENRRFGLTFYILPLFFCTSSAENMQMKSNAPLLHPMARRPAIKRHFSSRQKEDSRPAILHEKWPSVSLANWQREPFFELFWREKGDWNQSGTISLHLDLEFARRIKSKRRKKSGKNKRKTDEG